MVIQINTTGEHSTDTVDYTDTSQAVIVISIIIFKAKITTMFIP